MPEGGRITVATANVELTGADAATLEGIAPGRYVRLTVSDTGTGMTPEVQSRAFEPFFTTKGHGKGTGLGLATIYGFVRQSGGHVSIESEPGRGTAVSIHLPRHQSEAPAAEPAKGGQPQQRQGGETVLVVEDNAAVRRVTVERLAALGYRTLEAEGGQAALDLLSGGAHVDLVFSDVVMPGGLSGFDLAGRVRSGWPALAVVLTSGYAPEALSGAEDGAMPMSVLGKPYSQAALAEAISQALAERPPQARSTSAVKT
jgi:CheY-like chemotaxis protein